MIQRVQSIYWLLSIAFLVGAFFAPLFSYGPTGEEAIFTGTNCPGIMISAGLSIVTALAAIFMFSNRDLQIKLGYLNILWLVGVHVFMWGNYYYATQGQDPASPGDVAEVLLGVVLPTLAFVFNFLAIGGVKKDRKLVKSADRLR